MYKRQLTICIFLILCIGVNTQEVAVLLGGRLINNGHHIYTVDVFTKHLEESERFCMETGVEPSVPDLPLGISSPKTVFLPNSGIYSCGWFGDLRHTSSECWKYDPRVNRYIIIILF